MKHLETIELNKARMVAEEYRNRGYEVDFQPEQNHLPDFLMQFKPDIIARKGDETIVIEVKTRYSLSQNPQIRDMARLIQEKKGWKFELVVVGVEEESRCLEGTLPYTEEDIIYKLEDAKKLIKSNYSEASLLYVWSAAEAALRLIVEKEKIEVNSLTPLHIIKNLTTDGVISRDNYGLLMAAMKIRNAVAHGYKPIEFNPDIIQKLIIFTEGILRQPVEA